MRFKKDIRVLFLQIYKINLYFCICINSFRSIPAVMLIRIIRDMMTEDSMITITVPLSLLGTSGTN